MQTQMLAADAFRWACALDVAARKPGNVSLESPGHGMQAEQFLESAKAAAGPVCAPGARVGERIEAAVRASRDAAQCNTNLGIVLLCAPLAAASERWAPADGVAGLRAALEDVLQQLDVADAAAAYRAIRLANPGGLGAAEQQDVAQAPTVGLRAAMALAAHRDRIAWQYVHAHADVFEIGLPAFLQGLQRYPEAGAERCAVRALQAVYVEFLAALPDSHIARKQGPDLAHSVMREAQSWRTRWRRGEAPWADPAFAKWDEDLKARGINPGTTADLCVATAFLAALCASRTPAAHPCFPRVGPARNL
jgi:triphosphoribosyl-dephospho-CoA synthase